MAGSQQLYSAMAGDYDAAFEQQAHRRAYDALAGRTIERLLPEPSGLIVDAGCGTGKWAERWIALGHRVIGIEESPGMIDVLQKRNLGPGFSLITGSMEDVSIAEGTADLVVAMGSVQYAAAPDRAIRRFASWTKPGGAVCVYVDSLVGLIVDLIRMGKWQEALVRLQSRRGVFSREAHRAELKLYDRETLLADLSAAGLVDVDCRGLLISNAALGQQGCAEASAADEAGFLAFEDALAEFAILADVGKHIIASGRRPA